MHLMQLRMSRHVALVVSAVLAVGSVCNGAADSTTGPQGWLEDYATARQESNRQGLPLLIHFSASWCGPCQRMERETLHSSALMSYIGKKIIALKIDSDQHPDLVEAFRVESLPTDLIIAPSSGKVVSRTAGYQASGKYLASVRHWSGQFPEERAQALARLTPRAKPEQPLAPSESSRFRNDRRRAPRREQVPGRREQVPRRLDQQPAGRKQRFESHPGPIAKRAEGGKSLQGTERPQGATGPGGVNSPLSPRRSGQETNPPLPHSPDTLIGLDGYSPVAIKNRRTWTRGRRDLSAVWQGVIYYFASEKELRAFRRAPHRYAPRMLGCDPVVLWEDDRAVQGDVRFGAFYAGDLFLFSSSGSRNRFKRNPDRYVQVRHVLNPAEITGKRLR